MAEEQHSGAPAPRPEGTPEAAAIRQWLVTYIADLLEFEPAEVNAKLPLSRYGLDSTAAVALMGDLSEWLGREISPTLLYEHRTIDALADFVSAQFATLRKLEK
jgi:acyl carrier protein